MSISSIFTPTKSERTCKAKTSSVAALLRCSERAHKWLARLFADETSKNATFVSQVAGARNRHLTSLLLRQRIGLSSSETEGSQPQLATSTSLHDQALNVHRRRFALWLDVDDEKLRTVRLSSNAPEFALVSEDTLLQDQGYTHLYWSILVFLAPATTDMSSADALKRSIRSGERPLLRLEITYGAAIGQNSERAAAAPYLHCIPFSVCETFIEVKVGGEMWYGLPMLLFWCTLLDGTRVPMAFLKYLSRPITGLEREILPLPSTFPIHQWEMTRSMGAGHHHASPLQFMYGVVAVASIMCVVPTACIGNFPSAVLPSVLKAAVDRLTGQHIEQQPKRRRRSRHLFQQLRDGPLIAQNVHAYM